MATDSKQTDSLYPDPAEHVSDRALQVSADRFARFDLWMDMRLADLENRHGSLHPTSSLRTALRSLASPQESAPRKPR